MTIKIIFYKFPKEKLDRTLTDVIFPNDYGEFILVGDLAINSQNLFKNLASNFCC